MNFTLSLQRVQHMVHESLDFSSGIGKIFNQEYVKIACESKYEAKQRFKVIQIKTFYENKYFNF